MQTLTRDFGRHASIDRHYEFYLNQNSDISERWLLEQTLLTGAQRRGILSMIPLLPSSRVLDIGTGFGALAFDVAASADVSVTAVDIDTTLLGIAQQMYDEMKSGDCFNGGSEVEFIQASTYQLPFEDNTFDLVLAQFVYQHLEDPALATAEIARVLRPGGNVCLIDVDDQLNITHTETSEGFTKLNKAVSLLQSTREGDRLVGRKLSGFMHKADLSVLGTLIYPQAQFTVNDADNPGFAHTLRRFQELREAILQEGLMSASEFDHQFEKARTALTEPAFHANGVVVALGHKVS